MRSPPRNSFARAAVFVCAATGALLLIPLIAMRFTSAVDWSFGDFIAATFLLGGSGLAIVYLVRRSANLSYRLGVGMAVSL